MIYVVDDIVNFTQHDFNRCIPFLSAQRLDRMREYRFDKERWLCMLSYMLLRLGLKLEYDISEKPNFRLDSNGKPQLEQWPDLHMNLSHCAETVACAVDFAEVGVDVQNTEAYSKQLGKRVLTHKEQTQISQDPWPDRRFTEIWSLKEAYGKYRGNGVLYDLLAADFSAIGQGWTNWNDLTLYLYSSQRYALSFCGENQLAARWICVQELIDLLAPLEDR